MSEIALSELVRSIPWKGPDAPDVEPLLTREWLVTNGLGGYASGTISGVATRRYHGILIAALPAPFGRTVMLNHLSEMVRLPDGTSLRLSGVEHAGGLLEIAGAPYHTEFRLENGLPIWRYELHGFVLEKRVLLRHLQNTAQVTYSLLEGDGTVRLKLRPSMHFRGHEDPVSEALPEPYELKASGDRLEFCNGTDLPPLRMKVVGERSTFTLEGKRIEDLFYRVESRRGYQDVGDLWSPGHFAVSLSRDAEASLIASTEGWEVIDALTPGDAEAAERMRRRSLLAAADPRAQDGPAAELVLAADQFIIKPAGRVEDEARARASGEEARTVIAGYHWFTDWGRDTMISLPGLTLTTGREVEASWILRTFAHYVRDGLIPNMFPDGQTQGLYHTADATLWFFEAVQRYLTVIDDRVTLEAVLPKLLDIFEHHVRGTQFGIHVDPKDGLLNQGAEGYQLTWMDAKVDDWVVTPRRGKAVEINALWYNALRLLEGWLRDVGHDRADAVADAAERCRKSFNERFWNGERGFLFDVVDGPDGNDPVCRPNQVLSISLSHPVLERERWEPVIRVVKERLLTPVGLRSLAQDEKEYKPWYDGDLRARDAAYHQGTVWSWLIGPFIDAWLKVYPDDRAGARRFLEGFLPHLDEACVGSVSEIFDAEEPFTPRGCVAQAWGVAELLRCWVLTAD